MMYQNGKALAMTHSMSFQPPTNLVNAPIGSIVAWSGTAEDVPEGWHVCDGEAGTLDLRDKFMLGAGDGHPVGETGGEETHILTSAEMPVHRHSFSAMSNSVAFSTGHVARGTGGTEATLYGNNAGGNLPHNNMPPYYALLFIQKISATPTDYTTNEEVHAAIQEALENAGSSGTEYTGTDGVTIEGDTIGLDNPMRGIISQDEFDALPEEQRNKGTYIIPEPNDGIGGAFENVYSTEETVIGVWVNPDGTKQSLYRIVFGGQIPSTVSGTWVSLDKHIPNADVKVLKVGLITSEGYTPLPAVNTTLTGVCRIEYSTVVSNNRSLGLVIVNSIQPFVSSQYIAVLEYTKTTDTVEEVAV